MSLLSIVTFGLLSPPSGGQGGTFIEMGDLVSDEDVRVLQLTDSAQITLNEDRLTMSVQESLRIEINDEDN